MSAELRELFKRRRRRQWLVGLPMLGAYGLFILLDKTDSSAGLQSTVLIIGACAFTLAAVGFSVWNWRCPSCDRYLGRNMNLKICGNCGFRLRE